MKLQMKREALAKLNRNANDKGGFWHRRSWLQRSSGATRRDRTGDLLITNFSLEAYAIDSPIGATSRSLAYLA